jgi:hypothetical protein
MEVFSYKWILSPLGGTLHTDSTEIDRHTLQGDIKSQKGRQQQGNSLVST